MQWRCSLLTALMAVGNPAAGQGTNPLDAGVDVPPLRYESPLIEFRAFDPDEAMQPWQRANERVGQIGGWRTYLKEAAKPGSTRISGAHAGMSRSQQSTIKVRPSKSRPVNQRKGN